MLLAKVGCNHFALWNLMLTSPALLGLTVHNRLETFIQSQMLPAHGWVCLSLMSLIA